ncbi:hypothetical protein [Gemmobacter sp. 24YEA27]|uniref:hypothetical protein n=1 Tax=Gemmobacter sp. 24YEA27 TaxID=3040672 RepID=UPI0024B37253|nr:hypothetical protein [Gemmobacter sp. 24YEA27]
MHIAVTNLLELDPDAGFGLKFGQQSLNDFCFGTSSIRARSVTPSASAVLAQNAAARLPATRKALDFIFFPLCFRK